MLINEKYKMQTRGKFENEYPEGAIIHYTASSFEKDSAINVINNATKNGYAFWLIDRSGILYKTHSIKEWGYHCGKSYTKELGEGLSHKTLGIEILCGGALDKTLFDKYETWFKKEIPESDVRYLVSRDNIMAGWYHKFTEAQENTLVELLKELHKNNPKVFKIENILGHDEVSIGRKLDPGASLSVTMPELRERLQKSIYG